MLGSVHLLAGGDTAPSVIALSLFMAGSAVLLLAVLGAFAFKFAGQAGYRGALWRGALVLVGALAAWVVLDRSGLHDLAAERRALDARTAELTSRAIMPGSALACLDAVASGPVEAACAKAIFATPEAVAAALAYVDARLSLLNATIAVAARDPSYRPALVRLRNAIEADRFGLVAHVLTTRGCNSADCSELKLLRDTGRVLANMKERTFDIHVGMRATAWNGHEPGIATASALPPGFLTRSPSVTTGAAPGKPVSGKYDFPSAASIPPVSIMSAEPALPPGAEPSPIPEAAPAPRRATQSPRRQSSREPAARQPLSVLPERVPGSQAPATR